MATSKDFEIIHKRYQAEALPHGVCIIRFCEQNGIVYKQYERWLKNRRKVAIHPVSLTNIPKEDEHVEDFFDSPADNRVEPIPDPVNDEGSSSVLFNIRIVTNSGMILQHRGLDYAKLLNLVQRLEGLC